MSKHILLFGAGRSATTLIEYLTVLAIQKQWFVTIADAEANPLYSKAEGHCRVIPMQIDLNDRTKRNRLVAKADIVISLMPPHLHTLVAQSCLEYGKHMLYASYLDENILSLRKEVEQKNIFFIGELGLDPGIDHMSAMKLINAIHKRKGVITSYKSYCGGLVAPECDNNPWHYKISWNPLNVVNAGKTGGVYKKDNEIVEVPYTSLFQDNRTINVQGAGEWAFYANRDSLRYASLYGLDNIKSIMRATLRHKTFCEGWNKLIALHLTDNASLYNIQQLSLHDFYHLHCEEMGVTSLLHNFLQDRIFKEQLDYLGLNDTKPLNIGMNSAAGILLYAMKKNLMLQPGDKDMVLLQHEIDFLIEHKKHQVKSLLILKGNDGYHTAMAKTVGLPLGITAKLILEEELQMKSGIHLPVEPSLYEPVLSELSLYGINFIEKEQMLG